MHYYDHNLGDFALETRGLSYEQIGIYITLLDRYASTEAPITEAWVDLAYQDRSKCLALALLNGLFVKEELGWIHPRLQTLIENFKATSEKRRKAGAKGGKAKAHKPCATEVSGELDSNKQELSTCLANAKLTNNHKPLTINHINTTLPNGSVSADKSADAERLEPVEISPLSPVQKVASRCPHEKLIDLYHQEMPNNPIVRSWNSAKRRASSQARWKFVVTEEKIETEAAGLEWFRSFFHFCNASAFLRGQGAPDRNGRTFVPDLEWILTAGNFDKIIDRRYHD